MNEPKDGNGYQLHEGDRVFTIDFGYKREYGTLERGETFRSKDEWYVAYDDGLECIVLDFNALWRADKS